MNKTKDFHLGDILSITHDRLVSPNGIGGVYDILNFMTGDNLFTHQLPRAGKAAKPVLLEQHPQLAEINDSNVTSENWKEWLDVQTAKFGEYLSVTAMDWRADWTSMDPMLELQAMCHDSDTEIIAVKI